MASQKDRHKTVHHLSARNYDGTGWIESISNLTEENPATGLLIDKSAAFRVRTLPEHVFLHLRFLSRAPEAIQQWTSTHTLVPWTAHAHAPRSHTRARQP